MKIIRYKAYSLSNRDSEYVLEHGRMRGMIPGKYTLVYGNTIAESEDRLQKIYNDHINAGDTVTERKRGSFTVTVKD